MTKIENSSTLAMWYLSNADGDLVRYHQELRAGNRVGQAFFNALSSKDQEILTGTSFDPFYSNSNKTIAEAIDFLTYP